MAMRLTPTNQGYQLEASSGSINLTMEEALELAPLARQAQDHIRSRYPRMFPVYSYAVEEAICGIDAHHTQVLLRLRGQDGLEVSYQLSSDTARSMRDGLTRKIEQLGVEQKKRTPQ
jgi:hypothetical protein